MYEYMSQCAKYKIEIHKAEMLTCLKLNVEMLYKSNRLEYERYVKTLDVYRDSMKNHYMHISTITRHSSLARRMNIYYIYKKYIHSKKA